MAEIRQKGGGLWKDKGRFGKNRRAAPSKITDSKVEQANKNGVFDFVVFVWFFFLYFKRKRGISVKGKPSQRVFNVHQKMKRNKTKN